MTDKFLPGELVRIDPWESGAYSQGFGLGTFAAGVICKSDTIFLECLPSSYTVLLDGETKSVVTESISRF